MNHLISDNQTRLKNLNQLIKAYVFKTFKVIIEKFTHVNRNSIKFNLSQITQACPVFSLFTQINSYTEIRKYWGKVAAITGTGILSIFPFCLGPNSCLQRLTHSSSASSVQEKNQSEMLVAFSDRRMSSDNSAVILFLRLKKKPFCPTFCIC